MANLLSKAEGGFRLLQFLLGLIFTIMWVWMRTQGFAEEWNTAPPGAAGYGYALFGVGVLAGAGAVLASALNFAFILRSKRSFTEHSLWLHIGRFVADIAVLWLFVAERLLLNATPAQFLPDLLEPNNAATAKTFFQIMNVANAGIGVLAVLFGLTVLLLIAQAVYARKKRDDTFGKLEENPSTGTPYYQQNLDGNNSFRTQAQVYGGGPVNTPQMQQATFGGQQQYGAAPQRPPLPSAFASQQSLLQQQQAHGHQQNYSIDSTTAFTTAAQPPGYGGAPPTPTASGHQRQQSSLAVPPTPTAYGSAWSTQQPSPPKSPFRPYTPAQQQPPQPQPPQQPQPHAPKHAQKHSLISPTQGLYAQMAGYQPAYALLGYVDPHPPSIPPTKPLPPHPPQRQMTNKF